MSTAQQPVWHLTGQVITGPEEIRSEAWVVDGRLTFEAPPASMPTERLEGYVLPGLVDAHCHVGLESTGAVPDDVAEQHALAERAAASRAPGWWRRLRGGGFRPRRRHRRRPPWPRPPPRPAG